MPVRKGPGCVREVMKEWKAGKLHSGEGGKVVKDQKQAVAIALSMCGKSKEKSYEEAAKEVLSTLKDDFKEKSCKYDESGGEVSYMDCGCMRCRRRQAMAIGYPTPTFCEAEIINMVRTRLRVMHGRISDIEKAIELAMMTGGEVEMEPWMVDKITMAADYLSAVADNSLYGDGIEVEPREEEYAEGKKLKSSYGKGLTEEEKKIAKREAAETVKKAKSGKGAKEVYEDWESDKKYKARKKKKGDSMPKSKATEAYERMYDDDSEDMKEGGSDKALREKAKKSGIPLGILKQVFKRGMAAWRTGHRPGVSPQQWSMGRVNSFITGSGGARKADADLWKRAKKK